MTDVPLVLERHTKERFTIVADLAGAVNNPGVYTFESKARVVDLLKRGGGYSEHVDIFWVYRNINLAAPIVDASKIYIPYSWENTPEASQDSTWGASVSQNSMPTKPLPINVNTSGKNELEALPGIGPSYSEKLIQNRPYKDSIDLLEKSGVPKKILESFLDELSY